MLVVEVLTNHITKSPASAGDFCVFKKRRYPGRFCSVFMAHQYRSHIVNVFRSGSPSLMRSVRRISSQMSNYDAGICKLRGTIRMKMICRDGIYQ